MGFCGVRDPGYGSLLIVPFLRSFHLIDGVIFFFEGLAEAFANFVLALLPWWASQSHTIRSLFRGVLRIQNWHVMLITDDIYVL